MQHTAVFQEQVALTPRDMRDQIDSIDELLLSKLQKRLEGRCSRHGFVLPDTLKIVSRSMGVLEKGRFTGSVLFYVQAEGTVLNPPDGAVLEGEVIRKNKMGMYVNYQNAIRVIVPRDLHIGEEAYEAVELRETVKVEIKKSRFQVNDPFILSVGLFQGSVKKAPPPDAAPLAVPSDAVAEGEGELPEDEEAAAGGDEEAAAGGDEEAAAGGDEEAAAGGDDAAGGLGAAEGKEE